jgi:hypothetical protein
MQGIFDCSTPSSKGKDVRNVIFSLIALLNSSSGDKITLHNYSWLATRAPGGNVNEFGSIANTSEEYKRDSER